MQRPSLPAPAARPRSAVATRVLASFAVTVLAFAVTAGWGIVAQRRAAKDSVELARGYVPVALNLGQLRATQATLSTLIDGIPDERDPVSTHIVVKTLASARRVKVADTRASMAAGLPAVGTEGTQKLARQLTSELDAIEAELGDDQGIIERLFVSIGAQEKEAVNRDLITLGAQFSKTRSGELHLGRCGAAAA